MWHVSAPSPSSLYTAVAAGFANIYRLCRPLNVLHASTFMLGQQVQCMCSTEACKRIYTDSESHVQPPPCSCSIWSACLGCTPHVLSLVVAAARKSHRKSSDRFFGTGISELDWHPCNMRQKSRIMLCQSRTTIHSFFHSSAAYNPKIRCFAADGLCLTPNLLHPVPSCTMNRKDLGPPGHPDILSPRLPQSIMSGCTQNAGQHPFLG